MNKKQTIRLNENQFNSIIKNIVKESVRKILNEHYNDGEFEMIDLDGSVVDNHDGYRIRAVNMWFQNNTIVVRWVDDEGADSTSNLLEDNVECIWDILKSIKS